MAEKAAALEAVPNASARSLTMITVDPQQSIKRTRKPTTDQHETALQSLQRILGDAVLEVIPEDVREAVEAAYKFWEEHSDSYLITPFDDEVGRNDALTVMKAYAEIAPNGPYTIRVDRNSEPHVLHWRAQTRQGRKTGDE
jgi:hypothetical protein